MNKSRSSASSKNSSKNYSKSNYICPVCRAPMKVKLRDHLGFNFHLRVASLWGSLSLPVGVFFGWELALKVMFFYLPFWAVAEYVQGVKMRVASRCKVCDFDPILYRRDPRAARRKVEAKLQSAVDQITERGRARSAINQKPGDPVPDESADVEVTTSAKV